MIACIKGLVINVKLVVFLCQQDEIVILRNIEVALSSQTLFTEIQKNASMMVRYAHIVVILSTDFNSMMIPL